MADESQLKAQAREIELLPCPFCGNAPTRRNGLQFTADVPKDFAYCETETCPIKRVSIYLDEWNAREQVKAETADLRDELQSAIDSANAYNIQAAKDRATANDLGDRLEAVERLVDNDAFAISFQSLGQYRTAILQALREGSSMKENK